MKEVKKVESKSKDIEEYEMFLLLSNRAELLLRHSSEDEVRKILLTSKSEQVRNMVDSAIGEVNMWKKDKKDDKIFGRKFQRILILEHQKSK